MLKLLLDENIGRVVADALVRRGHDVKSVLDEGRGARDAAVLARAVADGRVLVTLDRDFGRLVFKNSARHVGVIYLRLANESPERILTVLAEVMEQYEKKLLGRFVTVSEKRIRFR